jgi:tetratricopeptide (TPR) repeat protein
VDEPVIVVPVFESDAFDANDLERRWFNAPMWGAVAAVTVVVLAMTYGRGAGANVKLERTVTTNASEAADIPDASTDGGAFSRGDAAVTVEGYRDTDVPDPADAAALNDRGQGLVTAGKAQEALPYFDRAISLNGNNSAFHFNRARAYAQLAEWGRAVAGYRDADKLFPNDYATRLNLAKALHASGDATAAIGTFESAIALGPGGPDFQLSYGLALEAAGRRAEAVVAYKRYVKAESKAPNVEAVRQRIAALEAR